MPSQELQKYTPKEQYLPIPHRAIYVDLVKKGLAQYVSYASQPMGDEQELETWASYFHTISELYKQVARATDTTPLEISVLPTAEELQISPSLMHFFLGQTVYTPTVEPAIQQSLATDPTGITWIQQQLLLQPEEYQQHPGALQAIADIRQSTSLFQNNR